MKDQILDMLRTVRDPENGRDLVALGMVRDVRVSDGNAFIHLELSLEREGIRDYFKKQILEKAKNLRGLKEVFVEFSRIGVPPAGKEPENLPAIRHVIAVASGKGGVGKTTVSVNLALALVQLGFKVGLMDGDIYGPNVPLMLGVDPTTRPYLGRDQKMIPIEIYGLRMISMGVLVPPDQPVIWRGPKLHGIVAQFLEKVDWGKLDFLIVDLPPGTGDVQLSLVQSVKLSGAVIVTTPQEVALMDARKGIAMFQKTNVPILGIIENMTGDVFGHGGGQKAAEDLRVPFLGEIPLDARIRIGADLGKPIIVSLPDSNAAIAFKQAAQSLVQRCRQKVVSKAR